MPKNTNVKFSDPSYYQSLSVCTTGTHDMSTIRGWWLEDRETTKEFCRTFLSYQDNIPQDCEPQICEKILELILGSPSMLAIFPLQDWLSISKEYHRKNASDERINIPSDPQHYWKYRMNNFIEDLKGNKQLCYRIRKMVEISGRTIK
jgi:4-alpha-glucanotransferase